jgi:hypothetical protein
LPVFPFDKALGIARGVKKAFLNPDGDTAPDARPHKNRGEPPKSARRRTFEQTNKIRSKRRELSRIREELDAAEDSARIKKTREIRKKKLELLQLRNDLREKKDRRTEDGPETGALPDFVVIGPGRSGTTFFYRLLNQHPLVEPAIKKELHFFDDLFDEGVEWYRGCFPQPKWKDGRQTITGEATPVYLFHPLVPERMAKIIPRAQLIALLRNPVDRTYSAYHHRVRNGRETRTFDEVIEAELDVASPELLSKGIYVDHLMRWSRYFSEEQMLVLKSEDLFERPRETLKLVLGFLDLPHWEPEVWKSGKKKRYEQEMDPATRHRLEEYFEPHNKRLYEYLGTDFGW